MTALQRTWLIPLFALLTWSGAEALADEPSQESANTEKTGARTAGAPRHTALVAHFTLKARDEKAALKAIRAFADENGGYLVRLSDTFISVKIEPEALAELSDAIAKLGILIAKDLKRQDLTDEMARQAALLRSKREILSKVSALLGGSDFHSTLEVERTMNQLVSEIESIEGQLRVMRERIRYASAEVSFQIKERDRYVYVQSPFDWLNRVHIDAFLEEFDDE